MHPQTRPTTILPRAPKRSTTRRHKVLIADDSRVNRFVLEQAVRQQGMVPLVAVDGVEALQILNIHPDVSFAILDWIMPKLTGLEVCRAIRHAKRERYVYIMMFTTKNRPADLRTGLEAGADDYLVKPVNPTELRLRIAAVGRLLDLECELREQSAALHESRQEISALSQLLPMCMYCKSVRDEAGNWHTVERYINSVGGEKISHGICPTCCSEAHERK